MGASSSKQTSLTSALQVVELPLEVVHSGRVQEGWQAAAREVVLQHLWVVLQDLPVDQLPHLLNGQLAALKVKRQLGDGLRHKDAVKTG